MLSFLYSPGAYAVAGAVLFLGYALYRASLPRPIPGIPYHQASAARILGDAPAMMRHKQQYSTVFDWMAAQCDAINSPVVQLFLKPFSRPVVVMTDPREAQDVLLRRARDFDRAQFTKDTFAGTLPNHHIIQPTGEKFKQGRRLIADTMTTGFLNKVAAPSLHRHALNLMELWRLKNRAAEGHAFAVADDFGHMALDSIWDVAFGSQLSSLQDEIDFLTAAPALDMPTAQDQPIVFPSPAYNPAVQSMKVLIRGLDRAATSPTPRQTHWLARLQPSYRRARAHKDRLIRERLDDAKARLAPSPGAAGDLAGITCATDHMVRREAQAAARDGRAPQYDSAGAQDEMFGFLVGGHETTATTLAWAVKHLADSPRVQARLRAELRGAFGPGGEYGGAPAADRLAAAQIPYLDAVVEELVRCAGTAPITARRAVRDTTLLGYRVPEGVDVYLLSNAAGYMAPNGVNDSIPEHVRSVSSRENKDRAIPLWDPSDIGAFRPERWLKTDDKACEVFDAHAGPVLQFGGGIRGCFGKKLAYLEMRIIVAVLAWTYELVQVPEVLRGYEALDGLTHKPKKCYLMLKEVSQGGEDK